MTTEISPADARESIRKRVPRQTPARNRPTVGAITLAKLRLERRLLVENDDEMKEQEHQRRVLKESDAAKKPRLAGESREHAVVHGVSSEAIQTTRHEDLRRIE